MNRRLRRPLLLSTPVAALVLALGLALSGCEDSVAVTPPPAPQAAPVTVAEVLSKPLRDWHEFTGRLEAESTVELRPRVGGYVERVAFTEGARVQAGDLLFAIDARPFRAEVARLAAEGRLRKYPGRVAPVSGSTKLCPIRLEPMTVPSFSISEPLALS